MVSLPWRLSKFLPGENASLTSVFQHADDDDKFEPAFDEDEKRSVESLKKEVERIRQRCRNENREFTDEEFSEHNEPNVDKKFGKMVRPSKMKLTGDDHGEDWRVFSDPSVSDPCQYEFGDCWLLAAASVAASKPWLLKRIFVTKKYNIQGVYGLRLFINGTWNSIIVDDLFPSNKYGRPVLNNPVRKQLWVSLIQKAVAKTFGGYGALEKGSGQLAMKVLTGYCSEFKIIDGFDPDDLFRLICEEMNAGSLMSCSSKSEPTTPTGIVDHHEYALLAAYQYSDYKLLCIRNVWGKDDFEGRWTEEFYAAQDIPKRHWPTPGFTRPENGIFWIDLHEFFENFTLVQFCYVRKRWNTSRIGLMIPRPALKYFYVIDMEVLETTKIHINIAQQKQKTLHGGDFEAIFLIFDDNFNLIHSCTYGWCNQLKFFSGFSPGKCKMVCLSFSRWGAPVNTYTFICDSEKPVEVREHQMPVECVRDLAMSYVASIGKVETLPESDGLMSTYVVRVPHWNGRMVAAVNDHPDKVLQVDTNLTVPDDATTTRGVEDTVDYVSPGCQQLINIATSLEISNSVFLIKHEVTMSMSELQDADPPVEDFLHEVVPIGEYM